VKSDMMVLLDRDDGQYSAGETVRGRVHIILTQDVSVKGRPTNQRYHTPASIPTSRGVVRKKKWGTPETRLRQRFLNNLCLHARTLIHVRKIATADLWSCPAIQLLVFECLLQIDINSAVLKLSYTVLRFSK